MKVVGLVPCIFFYFLLPSNIIGFVDAYNWPSSVSPARSWPASLSDDSRIFYGDITVQVVLSAKAGCLRPGLFSFGFFGNQVGREDKVDNYQYTLGIFIGVLDQPSQSPTLVWYANGDYPVTSAATLHLTADAGLVLTNQDGRSVWSTNISAASSVRSLNLTCQGNLVIFGGKGEILWQSIDDPKDTWVSGQTMPLGARLKSKVSSNNLSSGNFYLSIENYKASAFFVDPPNHPFEYGSIHFGIASMFVKERNGYILRNLFSNDDIFYLRLDGDGHLNKYEYNTTEVFMESALEVYGGDCGYPTNCQNYGVCYNSSNCLCPQDGGSEIFFRPVDNYQPNLGCTPIIPLSCAVSDELHTFVMLENVTYVGFQPSLVGVDLETCKTTCLKNCSCKAAIFHYQEHIMSGNCSMHSEVFTLMHLDEPYVDPFTYQSVYSSAFIKVQRQAQNAVSTRDNKSRSLLSKLFPPLSASILFIVLSVGACYYVVVVRRKKIPESHSDLMIDTVIRFSIESMRLATQDFQTRLGRGGFGSVFEGTLEDGTKVAVKRLDSVGQGKKEFLAEVNIIGKLHHYNLVKLIGFCDDGSNRLLVYEFMPNGSLDKWIFDQDLAQTLTWSLRRRVIAGLAKGLEYLHENCLQNVIHFDIKPQNILLDRDFNVKISDFGLAKMVDRDQSHVMTIIRGTPGYMAPELITAQVISVKVDVYSFGVLILEIVCGRKNFGTSEHDLLTNLVKLKADEDRLSDLIDGRVEDMQTHKVEAVKMMKIGIWCLQPHFIRPNMSMVVKVLQDLGNIDVLSDLSYLTMAHENTEMNPASSTRPTESILSGPR